jgi:hypothetical protein
MPAITDTGAALFKRIQNERFIKLAFEGHRYFDPRRWKTAPVVFNESANGYLSRKILLAARKPIPWLRLKTGELLTRITCRLYRRVKLKKALC